MKPNFTPGKASLVTWACVMVVTLSWTASAITGGTWLRSNVFELLPKSDYDPLKEIATRVVENELGSQILFLVGHPDRNVARASADRFGARRWACTPSCWASGSAKTLSVGGASPAPPLPAPQAGPWRNSCRSSGSSSGPSAPEPGPRPWQ